MTPTDVRDALGEHGYLADTGLATAVFLSLDLGRPLLLEGDAGVGKTELAKAIASWTGGELIRLQCYEGIDSSQAVYDWDYARQLLHLRAAEATGETTGRSAFDQAFQSNVDTVDIIQFPLIQHFLLSIFFQLNHLIECLL